jgi:hypothetical protein
VRRVRMDMRSGILALFSGGGRKISNFTGSIAGGGGQKAVGGEAFSEKLLAKNF